MEPVQIPYSAGKRPVSGLLSLPPAARFMMTLAHGAGAGMQHPFMEQLAAALSEAGIATLRYQFPYMEEQRKRPDRPELAREVVSAALARAAALAPGLPLIAGGKSYGGRMSSLLAARPLGEIPLRGLVFYGFPLHPAGSPGTARAAHLEQITLPMLFLQGTRDRLADETLIRQLCSRMPGATLRFLEGGDHSFHTLKGYGMASEDIIRQLAAWTLEWADSSL